MSAAAAIRAEIDRHGPIAFSRFQHLALYGPGGFYERGGAGRSRDFLTSPEVGPLFGAVLARWLDSRWSDLGCPDPFVVVEAGAGPGTLAAAVLAAEPACGPALRYLLVERAEAQRERQRERLRVTPAAEAFADATEDVDGEPLPSPATGPLVVALESLPRTVERGVIIGNELLDNLPVDLVQRTPSGWSEVRVGACDDGFVEVLVPASDQATMAAERLAPGTPPGHRLPLQRAAGSWLRDAFDTLRSGSLLTIDYMRATHQLADLEPAAWLRTYRGHERAGDPLVDPGSADITCDVALDQLAAVEAPASVCSQAEWLGANGIDELVAEGRRIWSERAAIGDLAALRARSRIGEAEALTDPSGLGGFTVAEWRR